jgi:Bifunctional DNA primase/polymerase, N-terminal
VSVMLSDAIRPQLRAALDLYALGLSVIPIHHPGAPLPNHLPATATGKAPLTRWEAYRSRGATPEELHMWFDVDEPRNLGVVCGRVSGIVVVDCDDEDALQVAADCLPATPVRTITSKGAHLFFRYPDDAAPSEVFGNKTGVYLGGLKYRIDIRADAGYVVAPPSVHATGVEYIAPERWSAAFVRMPMLTAGELRALYREPERRGATVTTLPPGSFSGDAVERARRYFAKVPPAIEGCGGDHATFVQACRAIRDFGLSDAEALDVLRDWNNRCVPPWSERELATKLANATRYGKGATGTRLVAPAPVPHGRTGSQCSR